jgi:hypothetical protein
MLGLQPKIATLFKAVLFPAAMVFLIGGVCGQVLVSPSVRMAENQENLPTKEGSEEYSPLSRFDHQRQLRFEVASTLVALAPSAGAGLGHTQHVVFSAPPGHRLPNGLLAPLTC